MKLLRCPVNGVRPLQEFTYGGEYRPMPDPGACSDEEWGDYVFHRSSDVEKIEWWYHDASGVWLLARRNVETDEFIATWLYEEWER